MHPETVIALMRVSDLNRQLSHPMTVHRHEANRLRWQAGRGRRIGLARTVVRAVRTAVSGDRIGRTEPAT